MHEEGSFAVAGLTSPEKKFVIDFIERNREALSRIERFDLLFRRARHAGDSAAPR